MMEEFTLSSSWLAGGSYDPETLTLTLTTQSGGEYTFEAVPQDVVDGLKTSPSPGSFYARQIKGRY